jgi:uracil phosphoribosyltransferase
MTVHNLSLENSLVNHFMAELRNVQIQGDRLRFRLNMKRLGHIFAYEISKTFSYTEKDVETPLGIARIPMASSRIVLASVLRAGLPLHDGILEFFDEADNAFIAAYRKNHKDGSFEINLEYVTCPNLNGATLILVDPMLATGASVEKAIHALTGYGKPKTIHIVSIIASSYGVKHVKRHFPKAHLWIAAEDEELTAKSYIVPGLGDAGDLAFGSKLQE